FQAQAACRILLYDAVQKLLHGMREDIWTEPLIWAEKLLGVLAECAGKDPIAHEFHSNLKPYSDMLNRAQALSPGTPPTPEPFSSRPNVPIPAPSSKYLLDIQPGTTVLHRAARRLSGMACNLYERSS
ncbi:hypothetical protein H2203_001040, partial [Taxawa tesnikishii (nom. ined.)]